MICPKILIKARKWHRVAALGKKRISLPNVSSQEMPEKGHFVVYTADAKRFVYPIKCLNNFIVQQLFKMHVSEEEFGLPSDGPTTLPCDAAFMEYVVF